jgi:hypothetical protein
LLSCRALQSRYGYGFDAVLLDRSDGMIFA